MSFFMPINHNWTQQSKKKLVKFNFYESILVKILNLIFHVKILNQLLFSISPNKARERSYLTSQYSLHMTEVETLFGDIYNSIL